MDNEEDNAALDDLEVLRERLNGLLGAFATGQVEVINLAPGVERGAVAELIQDRIANVTTTLSQYGRG